MISSMNELHQIGVLGGTGKAGAAFVRLGLQKGYRLKLLVRSQDKAEDLFAKALNKLTFVVGDATQPSDIHTFTYDCSAVVSLLGHGALAPPDLQTRCMSLLLPVMDNYRIKRLISLTGFAVPHIQDKWTIHHWIINTVVQLFDPERIRDGREHAELIKASQLDWTIVRTPLQIKHDFGLPVRVGYQDWLTGITIDREQLVQFMWDCLEKNKYIQELPLISNSFD